MTTTRPSTKKHRASSPRSTAARADLSGGAHRSSRNAETIILLTLGTGLIVLSMVMTLRG